MCKQLLAALVLVLLLMPAATAFASEPVISVESVNGNAGETVEVSVGIAGNPGVSALVLWLEFDPEHLEPVAVVRSDLLSGGLFVDNLDSDSVNITWANTTNFTEDGVMYTISFEVKRSGDTDLVWNTNRSNVSNQNLELVDVSLEGGRVLAVSAGVPILWLALPGIVVVVGTGVCLHKRSGKKK